MSNAVTGLLAGLLLALIAVIGGFGAFLLAVVLGAVGLLVGVIADGKVDLPSLLSSRGRG